jgi:hypothetical protein
MRAGKALPLYPRVAEAASGTRCRAVVIPAPAVGTVEHAAAHAAPFAPGTKVREGEAKERLQGPVCLNTTFMDVFKW